MNGIGVDKVNELFDLCVKFGIFKKSGSFVKDAETGDVLGQGKTKVVAKLRANEDGLFDKYEPLMLAQLHSVGSADTESLRRAALERGDDEVVDILNEKTADATDGESDE